MNPETYKINSLEGAARPYVYVVKATGKCAGKEVLRCYSSGDFQKTYSLVSELVFELHKRSEDLRHMNRWIVSERDVRNLITGLSEGLPAFVDSEELRLYEFVVNKSSPNPYISIEWGKDGLEPEVELFRLALDGDETYLRNLVFTLIKKANEHYLFAPKGPIDHLKGCEVTANDLLLFIDMLKRGVQPFPRPSVFNGAELKNTISIIESLSGETTAERAGIKLLKSMADKWVIDTEKPDGILLVKNDLDVITDMLKQLYALCRDNSLPTDIYLSPDSSGATGSRSRNDIESILRVLSHDGGAGLRRVFREE